MQTKSWRRVALVGASWGVLFAIAMMGASSAFPDTPELAWIRGVFVPAGALAMAATIGDWDRLEGVAIILTFVGTPFVWAGIGAVLALLWMSVRRAFSHS